MGSDSESVSKNNAKEKRRAIVKSKEDAEFIIQHQYDMTYKEIGEVLGLTKKQVGGWILHHIPSHVSKRRIINDTYFDEIVSPDQAYWLGFIYADGWVTKHLGSGGDEKLRWSYEFGMQLQRRDRYILEALNKALGDKNIIKDFSEELVIAGNKNSTHTESSVLRVYSKGIVEGLVKNGIDYRKTGSDVFPIVADELFPDFLRGYIDGDGCIHYMKNNHLAIHITSACLPCLEYLRSKLFEEYSIDTRIYKELVGSGYRDKCRLYCFRNDSVKRLLDMIYYDPGAIKLERKYDIYKEHYGLAA